MNKEIFDLIMKYREIESAVLIDLENKLGEDESEKLLDKFIDFRESILQIGKYTDESKLLNKDGYLKESYEDLERYLKITIIYKYNNGYSLCDTFSGLVSLIPTRLIET